MKHNPLKAAQHVEDLRNKVEVLERKNAHLTNIIKEFDYWLGVEPDSVKKRFADIRKSAREAIS